MKRNANWTDDRLMFRDLVESSPLLAWITEEDGYCMYLSSNWYKFTGTEPGEGEGYGWLSALHPDDRSRAGKAFFAANESKTAYDVGYRLSRPDGTFGLVWAHGVPRFNADHVFQGFIGTTTTMQQYAEKLDITKPIAPKQPPVLTNREREVLTLIATGQTSEAVAAHLGISPKTVNVHAQSAVTKLGASNRISAIVKAAKLNEIEIFPDAG